jgi:hypothetical protein
MMDGISATSVAHGDATTTRRSPQDPRRRVRRAILVFVLLLIIEIIAVVGWAGWALVGARHHLMEGRRQAAAGQQAISDVDLAAAEQSFSAAESEFAAGHEELGNPAVRVLGFVPVIGPNLRTIEALTVSGQVVAASVADVVGLVNQQPGRLRAFLPSDGRFPVGRLARLADAAETAEQRMADAVTTVETTPSSGLLGPIADAQAQFSEQVVYAQDLMTSAASASRAVVELTGADGSRRYLFGAQNPSELRGTGGFIGAYAIASFDRGTFELGPFRAVQNLTSLPISQVPPPNEDYAARYNRYGGAGFWQAINATPDFPSAAAAMVRLYERTEDGTVDGVVVVDPFVLEALLRLVGDVNIPGLGRVGPDGVVSAISVEARAEFTEQSERKEVLGEIAGKALRRLLAGGDRAQPTQIMDTFLPVVRERHMLLYSTDPELQARLVQLNLAGALPDADGDTVSVVVNNAAVNKSDFFTKRLVDYQVQLRPDGSATARIRVAFDNQAPELGSTADVVPGAGDNLSLVSIFCGRCDPTGARPRIVDSGIRRGTVIEQELGHTVGSTLLKVPRGITRSVELSWDLADAWSPDGDGCYVLEYTAQPTIKTTRLDVRVNPPDGFAPIADGGGDGRHLHAGPAGGVLDLQTCYAPSGGA